MGPAGFDGDLLRAAQDDRGVTGVGVGLFFRMEGERGGCVGGGEPGFAEDGEGKGGVRRLMWWCQGIRIDCLTVRRGATG